MSKFLVTGAAGFIGSALTRAILDRGDEVRAFDNLSTGKRENIEEIAGRVEFREADLCDPSAVREACKGIDFILHEAALPSVPRSVADPVSAHDSNVTGTSEFAGRGPRCRSQANGVCGIVLRLR